MLFIKFLKKVVSAILYLFRGKFFLLNFLIFLPLDPDPGARFPIQIRIHKVTESGSNLDPDPQP
jgi:hypothetical protein